MTQLNQGEQNESKDLVYYLKKNRFFDLFFDTKKYLDFFWSKEALITFVLALTLTALSYLSMVKDLSTVNYKTVFQLSNLNVEDYLNYFRNLIFTICGGFFSLLGLSLAGLALITGTIQDEFVKKIESKNSFHVLISIIFNFYFAGGLIALTIIILLITYFISLFPLKLNVILLIALLLLNFYFVIFSLIYTVMLLGTCIRMFMTRYYILNKNSKKEDNN
jgi:hypothetical protein